MTLSKPCKETMDEIHWKIYQDELAGKEKLHGSCVTVDPTWGDRCRRIEENAKYWEEVESLLSVQEAA